MLEILEKHKKIKHFENTIMISVMLSKSNFNNIKDKHNHKRYFKDDEHILITSAVKLRPNNKSNVLEATRIAEAKLERNYYRYIRKCQKDTIKQATKTINITVNDLAKTNRVIQHINIHILDICNRLKNE